MNHADWTIERSEIERVAHEYAEQGYDVTVEPGVTELPDFMREYRPDLIARGSKDCLIIEVKQPGNDTEWNRIRAIAERVQSQPGWRFVLVSTERPDERLTDKPVHGPEGKDVRRLSEEARTLVNRGHREAALLLAWAAVEGGMRLAASREGIEIKRSDTWSLMRELVSAGLLERQRYSQLIDVFRFRSALAHGFQPRIPEDVPEAVDLAIRITDELLADAE